MWQDSTWSVLYRQEDDGEMRLVAACERPDGAMEVEERSDGELTALTYGTMTCVRKTIIQKDAVEAMLWALGPCEGDAMAALQKFYEKDVRFLSDLQDVLDAGGVPYTFSIACGNDYALRRVCG